MSSANAFETRPSRRWSMMFMDTGSSPCGICGEAPRNWETTFVLGKTAHLVLEFVAASMCPNFDANDKDQPWRNIKRARLAANICKKCLRYMADKIDRCLEEMGAHGR